MKVITTFSGIGMQERGIEKATDLELVATSEIDKDAILSYACIHKGLTMDMVKNFDRYPSKEKMVEQLKVRNIGYNFEKNKPYDWNKLAHRKDDTMLKKYWLAGALSKCMGDISLIKSLPSCDLLTFSSPCFTGETLVLTEHGYEEIKNLKIGDLVLSHDNNYHEAVNVINKGKKEILKIKGMCCGEVRTTKNHKFYTREKKYKLSKAKGRVHYFEEPIWKEAKDITKEDYLGYAINTKAIIPTWKCSDHKHTHGLTKDISDLMDNKDFWWIVGRFVADGYTQHNKPNQKRRPSITTFSINLNKSEEFLKHLDNIGFKRSVKHQRGKVIEYLICSTEFCRFAQMFGYKAHGKKIPSFVLDLPCELLKSFVEGYLSGDGSLSKRNNWSMASVSRQLIYGLGQAIAKAYKRPFYIKEVKRKEHTTVIEGRTVNQRDYWILGFHEDSRKNDKAFYEDGYIWFPISDTEIEEQQEEVWDITVEDSHSFTANGTIVHNCTDLSVAGEQKGMSYEDWLKGHSTRSGMLWHIVRLLQTAKENNNLPKYLLLENVSALVSKKFINDFEFFNKLMKEIGYNSYYEILNAKDFGIPQNRPRVFVVYIRTDIDTGKFEFPQPTKLNKTLKDFLLPYDEKYILPQHIQERFQFTDTSFTKNINGTTKPDFRTIGQRDVVYKEDCIMGTLCSSDFKQPRQILTKCCQIGTLDIKGKDCTKRVYSEDGLSPVITTCGGGNTHPKVLTENYLVRKLTPSECFALMGLTKEDCQKCYDMGLSDTQLYKQAGNGLVTTVITALIEKLLESEKR